MKKDFGQERFLIDDPIKLFRKRNFYRVPVIAGMTENEFIDPAQSIPQLFFFVLLRKLKMEGFIFLYKTYFSLELLDNNLWLQRLNNDFEEIAPMCFLFQTEKSKEISNKLSKAYLPYDVIDGHSFNSSNNVMSLLY